MKQVMAMMGAVFVTLFSALAGIDFLRRGQTGLGILLIGVAAFAALVIAAY